jgi:hypothetical protein
MHRIASIVIGLCCLLMVLSSTALRADSYPAGFCCVEGYQCDGALICKTETCVVTVVPLILTPGTCREFGED